MIDKINIPYHKYISITQEVGAEDKNIVAMTKRKTEQIGKDGRLQ